MKLVHSNAHYLGKCVICLQRKQRSGAGYLQRTIPKHISENPVKGKLSLEQFGLAATDKQRRLKQWLKKQRVMLCSHKIDSRQWQNSAKDDLLTPSSPSRRIASAHRRLTLTPEGVPKERSPLQRLT